MISLITSLFKSDRYIDSYQKNLKMFASVLLKNGVDFEVIVIANDETKKEHAFYECFKNESWIKYLSVPREPLYATWNRGIKMAQGDVIGFWNVDDVRRAEAVLEAIKLFNNGAELVYFSFLIKWYLNILNHSFLVKWRNIIAPNFDKKEFKRSMHCGPFFMFSKNLYDKVGPFDEQFKIVADFDWCIRAAKLTDKFSLAKESAGIFRVDGNGLSSGGKPIHYAENNIVYRRHNVNDKIISDYENLETGYCVDKIKMNDTYVEYNF